MLTLSMLIWATGCDDDSLAEVSPAAISVDPGEVTFALPAQGQTTSDVIVSVSNVGGADLIISGADLVENDDTTEISILDADDWTGGGLQIAAGETTALVLRWTILNEQVDTGSLTLRSNGGEAVVNFTTVDVDPLFEIETDPVGVEEDQGRTVTLDNAVPGDFERLRATITSGSVAALDIESVCLVDTAGDCIEGGESPDGAFKLCSGFPASLESGCGPVRSDDPLAIGATLTFTVFYFPPEGGVDTNVGTVLIRTNARDTPTYTILMQGSPCARLQDGDVCGTCGDGVQDEGESCDDGNVSEEDACLNDCTEARCGDGLVNEGTEDCDDANDDDTDACLSDCTEARCGDGVVQEGVEACDDGDDDETDGCLNDCTKARCGDGAVQEGVEFCDDGNDDDTDACLSDCTEARCGDGVVQEGVEVCDDGNEDDTDACLNSCEEARCGDGRVQEGIEACDDGNDNDEDGCLSGCIEARCGDGIVFRGQEQCDDANGDDTDACLGDCRFARCGDGVVQEGVEACDDDNRNDNDACLNNCEEARCGDGVVHEGVEECDDGNENDVDGCSNLCESNGAPTAPVVQIQPEVPGTEDTLTCAIVVESIDPDRDVVTYRYEWFHNGFETQFNTNTIPSIQTFEGDEWRCKVTPNDGRLDGPFAEDTTRVRFCSPNEEVLCIDGDVQVCNREGNGYDVLRDCGEALCVDGQCEGQEGDCTVTWNPLAAGPGIILDELNLQASSDRSWQAVRGTTSHDTGKWYFEIETRVGGNGFNFSGIGRSGAVLDGCCTGNTDSWGYYGGPGNMRGLGTNHAPNGEQWRSGTFVIGVAVDLNNGRIWWALDGVWQLGGDPAAGTGAIFTNVTGSIFPQTSVALANSFSTLRACRSAFSFPPPVGFAPWEP